MPTIARFHGVVIRMRFEDRPMPVFHAEHGAHAATVAIATGEVVRGYLPPRIRRMVRHWSRLHRIELVENWGRLRLGLEPRPVEPLP